MMKQEIHSLTSSLGLHTSSLVSGGALSNFRVQPMVSSTTHDLLGMELLFGRRVDFSNPAVMLEVDIAALKAAQLLSKVYDGKVRVHCNVEITSLINLDWVVEMCQRIGEGMVIEIVERNDILGDSYGLRSVREICEGIKGLGGKVALDDVSGSEIERRLIDSIRPDVLKANDAKGLSFISELDTGAIVVAEHIESQTIARQAMILGASELQGYWCDVLKERELPYGMMAPGVLARNSTQKAEMH